MDRDSVILVGKRCGFDYIDIIEPIKDEWLMEILVSRRREGYNTEFEDDNLNVRVDPVLEMDDVKSIIVVGLNYWSDINISKHNNRNNGEISRSSWGMDYHDLMRARMKELVGHISEASEGNYTYSINVDTGPLVDRQLAYRAGMGFYGMNNAIINRDIGSWIYIGYILANRDIEKVDKPPVKNQCGDCTRCIRACPTNAILGNHNYDGTKCISYLTQTKQKIPYELREKMGRKLYGCDICQLVCPYNSKIKPSSLDEVKPELDLVYPSLEAFVKISKSDFKKLYGDMSLSWRGKNVIVRNAIIAMGNTKDAKYIEALSSLIKSPSKMVREYSAWALARIGSEDSFKVIEDNLEDKELKDELVILLEYYRNN